MRSVEGVAVIIVKSLDFNNDIVDGSDIEMNRLFSSGYIALTFSSSRNAVDDVDFFKVMI